MTKTSASWAMLGAVAMGWGGASIDAHLGLTGWHSADLAIFAVGVILLGQLPSLRNSARIRRLEAELTAQRGQPGAS